MDLNARTAGDVPVLDLAGRFDAYSSKPVSEWLSRSASPRVVVNLNGVNFIDSTALGTLLAGMRRCRERGGNLHLCSLQQPVKIIIEITHLNRALSIFPDEESAVSAFGGAAAPSAPQQGSGAS